MLRDRRDILIGKLTKVAPSHPHLFSSTTIVVTSKLSTLNSTNSKVHHIPIDNAFRSAMTTDKINNSMSSQAEVEVKQIDGESKAQRGKESKIVISADHAVRPPV